MSRQHQLWSIYLNFFDRQNDHTHHSLIFINQSNSTDMAKSAGLPKSKVFAPNTASTSVRKPDASASTVSIVSRSSLDSYQELFNSDDLSQVSKFDVLDRLLSNELVTSSFNDPRIGYTISGLDFDDDEEYQPEENEVEDDLLSLHSFKIKLPKDSKRRYTIELSTEKDQDIFVFYNHATAEPVDVSISDLQSLKEAVIKDSDNWFYALINAAQIKQRATENAQYYADNEVQRRARLADVVVKYSEFKSTMDDAVSERNDLRDYISTLTNKLGQVTFDRDRFYQVRDYYKILLKVINDELVKVKAERDQAIALGRSNPTVDRYNYSLLLNANEFNQYSRQQTSHSYRQQVQPELRFDVGSDSYARYEQFYSSICDNLRYRDVSEFRGNLNDWDSWRNYLYIKIRNSRSLFSDEAVKIDYASTACKGAAYNIIKHRSGASTNSYRIVDELVHDLNNMFGKHDEFTINLNELVDKDFKMGYKDFNETFDSYLARFITTVAPLNFSHDTQKIYFTRNLSNRLQGFCIIVQGDLIFMVLVERMRQIDQGHRRADKEKELYQSNNFRRGIQRNNQSNTSAQSRTPNRIFNRIIDKSNSRGNGGYMARLRDWSKELKDKIKDRKLCSDCLVVGYLYKDADRLCKDKFPVLQDRATVILKAFGVELTVLELKQRFGPAETYVYGEESDENVDSDFEDSEKV